MSTNRGASPKRPKLSLSIKTAPGPNVRTSRTMAVVDPKSPTAFNTLSNVYVTAIERSTPIREEPLTAIFTQQPLRLQTSSDVIKDFTDLKHRIQTPHAVSYPETPLTAHPISPITMEYSYPSIMTATPPLSAGPISPNGPQMFTFSSLDTKSLSIHTAINQPEPRTPRRRATLSSATLLGAKPPYTHPRTLHSILRNSPLPPSSAMTPISPRRQSLRLQEKAARRVAYNSPLTQTISTNRYTKSHIDLLFEDVSPNSPAMKEEPETALDQALGFTAQEIQDGGMTPGPFEEMRRRMAGLGTGTPISPGGPNGIRKRKRKDKKRRWVWTIGQEEDDENVGGAMAAIRAAEAAAIQAAEERPPAYYPPELQTYLQVPTPSIESFDPSIRSDDVEMSDTSSFISDDRALTPGDMELDLKTPTVPKYFGNYGSVAQTDRLGSVDLYNPETGSRRDTPVPSDIEGN